MQRTILAVTIATLLALTPIAAQQQPSQDQPESERAKSAKKDKKHVEATLIDDRPAPTPTAAPAPAESTTKDQPAAATPPAASTPAESTAPASALTNSDADTDITRADSFQERVEVIEVQLDVVVKDGNKQVTGLGPDDFVVTEEGRPVEVTSATFYGTPEQLGATGEGEVERSDRYFIFLFHDRSRDATIVRPLMLDAGQQARKWVEEERLPNDQVAVMTYDVRLKIYTDFTRDNEQILAAIKNAVASKNEPDRGTGRSKEALRPAADSPSLLVNLPAGRDLARETRVFEDAIALLGRAAEGIVGRKNLLLFSIGFGETDPNGVWLPDVRYYPRMDKNLNDGNVAVYAIDLLGSRRGSPGGPGIASSLASIASDTAGLYYESFTNFGTPIKEAAKDTAGYYLLSYRSEYPRGTAGYREVKVDTRQKGYDVRARKGYLFGEKGEAVRVPNDERKRAPEEPTSGRG